MTDGRPQRHPVTLPLPLRLHAELAAEAWESNLPLNRYIIGLLQRRGKWARMVGRNGGYDLIVGRDE
jgi:hypothetical protein